MTSAAAFIVDNWSLIAPIIYGIAAALLLYNGYLITHNAIQAISNGLKTLAAIRAGAHGTATAAEMAATVGLTEAQLSYNAALYACPLTWILLLIIAVMNI